ncbi:MAG: hypothetical protein ACO1SV_08095 [Fimbriimonas sp.]
MTPDPRAVELAMELLKLGVSRAGVEELLSYGLDAVERQLAWLPYRKAKRKEALIVDAIRNNYSPPKEAYFAEAYVQPAPVHAVDEGSERAAGPPDAFAEGHGTEDPAGAPAADGRLEPGGPARNLDLP